VSLSRVTWQGSAFPAKDFTGPSHDFMDPTHDFIGEPHEYEFAGPPQEQTQRGHGRGRAPPPRLGDTDAGGAARWAGEGMGAGPPHDHMQHGVGVGMPLAPPAGACGYLDPYAEDSWRRGAAARGAARGDSASADAGTWQGARGASGEGAGDDACEAPMFCAVRACPLPAHHLALTLFPIADSLTTIRNMSSVLRNRYV